jgi:hypothetical protein
MSSHFIQVRVGRCDDDHIWKRPHSKDFIVGLDLSPGSV